MRYFRSTPAAYADICAQLDAAYGYPNAETKTERTLPVVADLPTDSQGRVYLAVVAEYCDRVLPVQMLLGLLASGVMEEIDKQTYGNATPAATLQGLLDRPPFVSQ